jgi:hypothetical protein
MDAVRRKCPKNEESISDFTFTRMLQHTGWFLVKDFLSKNNITTLENSPYSPNLPADDIHLFP